MNKETCRNLEEDEKVAMTEIKELSFTGEFGFDTISKCKENKEVSSLKKWFSLQWISCALYDLNRVRLLTNLLTKY